MISATVGLLAGDVPFPPEVGEFYPPSLIEGTGAWLTKFTLYIWVAVGLVILFFLLSYRNPKLVPTKRQWLAESVYGFVRENVAKDLIGHEGIKFAPYFATLFSFILLTNLFGIIPLLQVSSNSHIAMPALLAIVSWILFIVVGIRKHGLGRYLRLASIPPAPWYVLPLLVPIEIFSTFLVRPVTLSLRLFANMFAGHMILLVFTLGGFALLQANALLTPVSILSWAMAIALTFLEALVVVLQAYVFVVLTSSYVSGALAEEH